MSILGSNPTPYLITEINKYLHLFIIQSQLHLIVDYSLRVYLISVVPNLFIFVIWTLSDSRTPFAINCTFSKYAIREKLW